MDTGKVVLGLMAGLAVGAIAGILFAPEKGARTRKKIYREGEKITDNIKDKLDDILETINSKFESVKKDVTDFAEKTMEKGEEVEKDLEKNLKTAKH